jgi:sigma-B regulation protein RsbU (phosphoserine phosphatase)
MSAVLESLYAADGVDVTALSIPADTYTGDFYFTFEVGESLWFAVGDFAGHGIAAVIFMAMVQEELERILASCSSCEPAEVVAQLDRDLRAEFPSNRFASLVVGRLSPDGSLQLVNAGHCYPLLLRADGTLQRLCSNGPVVGLLPFASWRGRRVQLAAGDRLVIYTDGLLEARNEQGEEFGIERIEEVAAAHCRSETADALVRAARSFAPRFEDDLTVFVMQKR